MKRRRRRRKFRTSRHAAAVGVAFCLVGLTTALACLARIGPPPAARIDVLWVNDHLPEVQTALLGAVIATAGSALALFGRRRWTVVGLWGIAGAAAGVFFSDVIPIIARVLCDHAL